MKGIVPVVAMMALGAWSGDAAAAVVWNCEVLHSYGLGAAGAHEQDRANTYIGDRFTANDDTGEVNGPHLGEARGWRSVKRRFGPDQDGFQAVYSSGDRQLRHLYIESFAAGAAKPFMFVELDIGATRTGTCRAGK